MRFEGNNYSNDWVVEAEKRKLLNLRRTPEALAQLLTKDSRAVLTKLGILSKPEIESRFHIRLERYVKDMLIEIHTLEEIVDTMVLPASFSYLGVAHEVRGGCEGGRNEDRFRSSTPRTRSRS